MCIMSFNLGRQLLFGVEHVLAIEAIQTVQEISANRYNKL